MNLWIKYGGHRQYWNDSLGYVILYSYGIFDSLETALGDLNRIAMLNSANKYKITKRIR